MLDELRNKSPYTKNTYAFWGAFGVTALIAAGWIVSLPVRFSDVDVSLDVEGMDQTANSFSEFFSEIKDAANSPEGETATTSVPETDPGSWGLNFAATGTKSTSDPILIGTSSKPALPPAKTIQIATSSAPNQ